jgi:hypothetical protein
MDSGVRRKRIDFLSGFLVIFQPETALLIRRLYFHLARHIREFDTIMLWARIDEGYYQVIWELLYYRLEWGQHLSTHFIEVEKGTAIREGNASW